MTTSLSPVGQKDSYDQLNQNSFLFMAFQGDYTGTNLIYKGLARPGALTSAAAWQIAKFTYDGSNNLISITWPQNANSIATSEFLYVWANRASYTYS